MIYLDYAATTPLDKDVLKKMTPYFSRVFANPASIHTPGQTALKAVEDARYAIANLLKVQANELIFTSGATEANNLALFGLLKALKEKGDKRREIITTAIEHDSILEPLQQLIKDGYVIKYLNVDKRGLIKPENLRKLITKKTALVSIGFVNSEVGVIQPIAECGRLIKKVNERRYKEWLNSSPRQRGAKPPVIYFQTDATQAFNYLSCDAQKLKVDLMSLSGHKVYGPKGIGLLFVCRNTPLKALQFGGHQEKNLRSGTLNVPGIIGLAQALSLADKKRKIISERLKKLRKELARNISVIVPGAIIASDLTACVPSHLSVLFPKVEGDALLVSLDELGVVVSTGSACASGDLGASHVLRALGYRESLARSAIRLTLGRLTTFQEIKETAKLIGIAYQTCLKRS